MVVAKDELIKGEILDAAQELFKQSGIRKTTMEDIARQIGKGKSTLYYYYSSKEEIFEAVVCKELEELFTKTQTAVAKAGSAEEKLKAYALTKINTLRRMSNLFRMVRVELLESPACYHHLHEEYALREVGLVSSILQFGIDNNEFDGRLNAQMDLMPFLIVSSLKGLEFGLYKGTRFDGLETRIHAVIDLLLNGLKINKHPTQ